MDFKKMCIGKFSYGSDKGKFYFQNKLIGNCLDADKRDVTNFNLADDLFEAHMNDEAHPNYRNIHLYLTHLAICHTVVIEEKKGKMFYNASSPDELALVNAAKYYHYEFKGRDEHNNVEILRNGQIVKH